MGDEAGESGERQTLRPQPKPQAPLSVQAVLDDLETQVTHRADDTLGAHALGARDSLHEEDRAGVERTLSADDIADTDAHIDALEAVHAELTRRLGRAQA